MEQPLCTQLMCLASYPLRPGGQRLFMPYVLTSTSASVLSHLWRKQMGVCVWLVTAQIWQVWDFECESLFCALNSCSAAFSLLWYPTSLPSNPSVSSPREKCPHCQLLTHVDLCLHHSLVWELLMLGAGAAWVAPMWVLLIANTENIIAGFTHRLLINTHTLLLQERMSSLVPSFSLLNVAYLWGKAQVGTVKAPVWRLFTLSMMKLLSYQKQGWLNIFLFKTFLW